MTNTQAFNAIIENLSSEDLQTVRGYILDTVRAEFGPLITSLSEQSYSEGTGEPVTDIRSDEDQAPQETESTFSIADLFGPKPDRAKDRDQHLRFHALQSALAWLSIDGHEGEPVVLANLFYGFLKGDA